MADSEHPSSASPSVPDYDVAIVGASIAGCTAATFLARSGATVALLESHSDPLTYKRMCTHLIQPSASPTIERLGMRGAIEEAGAQPNDLNIWTRFGWICADHDSAPAPLCDHPAWNIRRETFDPMLRELAAATEGVELMLGHTVTALLRDGGGAGANTGVGAGAEAGSGAGVNAEAGAGAGTGAGAGVGVGAGAADAGARIAGVVVRERDGSERELRARVVVAADGRDSSLAKLVDQPTTRKRNERFGYFAHYRDTPLVTGCSAQMWLLDPDVAYAFPTDGDLTLLACMPHKDRLPEYRPDPEQAMVRLFDGLPEGPRLDPAKRVSKMMGKLDSTNIVRQPTRPGLAFVGDAAIAADPLWGVGCGWALQSAEWFAEAVGPALKGGDVAVEGALATYAARHRKGLDAHEKFCSAYSRGKRFNPGEKLLFRAATRDEVLAGRMAEMGGRWITPQEMMTPRTIGRILRVNLSRAARPRTQPVVRRNPAPAQPAAIAARAAVSAGPPAVAVGQGAGQSAVFAGQPAAAGGHGAGQSAMSPAAAVGQGSGQSSSTALAG
jgi:flavin-dependent dehydrogenase